jgi:DNA-binding response OmpR family regulator
LYGALRVLVMLLDFENTEASLVTSLLERAGFRSTIRSKGLSREDFAFGFDVVLVAGRGHVDLAIDSCAGLRQTGYRGPIVVVGERDGFDHHITALERGADGFVSRPVQARELTSHLRAVLRRVASSHVRCGAVVIDLSEHVAYVHGRRLKLTAREYFLLACLTEAGGKVVSRTDLLARVWRRSDARSNLVEAHMSRLRNKLGAESTLIESVRLWGYRLRP